MKTAVNKTIGKWRSQSLRTIIICMISFMLFNFLTTVSLNVFIPAVAELKDIPTAGLYHANTIGNLISVVFALGIGVISKKVSLKTLTVAGLFVGGISYILIPLVPGPLTGIFIATNYIATMFYAQITVGARIGNWYPKRKGEILGIVTAIIVVSSLVWLPLFSNASEKFGIDRAMIFVGAIVIILAIIFIFTIHDRPQEVGLHPENKEELEEVEKKESKTNWTYLDLLKRPRFVLFSIGWGLSMPGMMGLSVAIIPIMISKGLSTEQTVLIAAFAGAFQLLGSVISGFMDTRIGLRFVITLFIGMEIAGLALFSFAPHGQTVLMIIGYYVVMFMMGGPNNLQPSSYLTMAGGGGSTYMLFYSLATAIASIIRATASSILAFSTSNFNGSYTFAMLVFLGGSILSIILLNVCGFKKLEKPGNS